MLTMNLVLWKAKSGINTATDWDAAAAYFFGAGTASGSEHTVYNRAQKRCKDYGTCLSTGDWLSWHKARGISSERRLRWRRREHD